MLKSLLLACLLTTLTCFAGCASAPPRPVAIQCAPPPPMPDALRREPSQENFQKTIGSILRLLLSDAPMNASSTPQQ